jgi:hypothetical protein
LISIVAFDSAASGMTHSHNRQLAPRAWRLPCIWLVIGVLTLAGGCSRRVDKTTDPDLKELENLVYNMSDLALDASRFRRQFAQGAAPGEGARQKYKDLFFKLAEPPKVEGDTAKLPVLVCTVSKEIPVEWIAVKESRSWRLKSAPLN